MGRQSNPEVRIYVASGPVGMPPRPATLAMVGALFALCLLVASGQVLGQTSDQASGQSTNQGTYEGAEDVEYPDWFKTSFLELADDIEEAQQEGKGLMLVFHQPGCPYCNAFVERNLAQKDIEDTVRDNFDVIEINIWGDREVTSIGGDQYTEKTFAGQLQVQFTPTVMMYDETGELDLRLNGYFPPEKFRVALDYVDLDAKDRPSFNEYLATRATSLEKAEPGTYTYLAQDDFAGDGLIDLPAGDQRKPYILLFEQRDCSNCVQLHEDIFTHKMSAPLMDEFNIIRLDMWGRDLVKTRDGQTLSSRELAQQLQINYAPTMVLYAADHTEVIRSESWLKHFHTQSILDYVQSDAWREQPMFQRYLTERSDAMIARGENVNIYD
jgi:thioredoxin-related protein